MKENPPALRESCPDNLAKLDFDLCNRPRPAIGRANGHLLHLDRAARPSFFAFAHGRSRTSNVVEETPGSGKGYGAASLLWRNQDVR